MSELDPDLIRRDPNEFKPGDRVELDLERLPSWQTWGPQATIMSTLHRTDDSNPSRVGYGKDGTDTGYYKVRLDGFDYGPNLSNCHTVANNAVRSILDHEVEQAIQSILKGASDDL